ncbi:MAG: hypothetical protein LBH37_03050 [Oscillospiraceae bacterium]|nr:hypothetical protein [Oscillospiraceae bacterium]
MGEVYKKTVKVSLQDCDMQDRMSASSILKNSQQASIEHCKNLNASKDYYRNNGLVFLLAQVSLEFYKNPRSDDVLSVVSEPFRPLRAIHYRYTEFLDAKDNFCFASVDSRWVLVDIKRKRIVRQPPTDLMFKNASECVKKHPHKLQRSSDVILIGRETATYSRCDVNHHLNNAEYANIIFDYLPTEVLKEKFPRRMLICYRKEIPLGREFELFLSESENNYYFLGANHEEKYFEVNVVF